MEQQAKLDQITEIALRSLGDIATPDPVSPDTPDMGMGIARLNTVRTRSGLFYDLVQAVAKERLST